MTASELQDIIVSALTKESGGSRRRWRIVVGPLRIYDQATHPNCNWSVSPSGSARETAAVEDLLDTFRLEYSIVTSD